MSYVPRVLLLGLVAVLFLALAACGDDDEEDEATAVPATAVPATAVPAAAATPIPIPTPSFTPTPAAPAGPTGTLTVGLTDLGPTYSCDPKTSGTKMNLYQGFAHESLLNVDSSNTLIPLLAKNWSVSSDNLIWTLELQQGVTFSKGFGQFTAQDVISSINRGAEEGSVMARAAEIRGAWQNEDGFVEISDDNFTIRVHTGGPQVFFTGPISKPWAGWVMSKNQADEQGWEATGRDCAGTGPWEIVEHRAQEFYRFTAVEDHWRKTPEFAELILRHIPEESTRLAGFQTGQLDIVQVNIESLPAVENVAGTIVMEVPAAGGIQFGMYGNWYTETDKHPAWDPTLPWVSPNTDVNSPEWETARKVREAITIAIDRQAIVDELLRGKGEASTLWAWMGMENRLPPGVKWSYDPVRAKQLLNEAGYPNGFDAEIMVYSSGITADTDACEAIGGMLQLIGIDITIRRAGRDAAIPPIVGREFNQFSCHGTNTRIEPGDIQRLYDSSIGFSAGFDHPTTDVLIRAARSSFDIDERFRLYGEVAKFIFGNSLQAGVYTASTIWPLGPRVGNFLEHQTRGEARMISALEYAPHR